MVGNRNLEDCARTHALPSYALPERCGAFRPYKNSKNGSPSAVSLLDPSLPSRGPLSEKLSFKKRNCRVGVLPMAEERFSAIGMQHSPS